MLFDIAILNAGTFITGASVRNFVFADLCAFEVSNGNIPVAHILRDMINAARDLATGILSFSRRNSHSERKLTRRMTSIAIVAVPNISLSWQREGANGHCVDIAISRRHDRKNLYNHHDPCATPLILRAEILDSGV